MSECGEVDPNYNAPVDPKPEDPKPEDPKPDPDPTPHEHSFVYGRCECGEIDPDYEEPSMDCSPPAPGFFEALVDFFVAIFTFFVNLFTGKL